MGHSSINMTFDLYGHLFENVEADRAGAHRGLDLRHVVLQAFGCPAQVGDE
jgi:hypothetical protein